MAQRLHSAEIASGSLQKETSAPTPESRYLEELAGTEASFWTDYQWISAE